MPFAHLVTLQLTGTDQLARDEADRCYLARLVLTPGDECGLLWWRVTGPYLHLVCRGDRRAAGQLARRVAIGAQQVLGRGQRFAPCRCRAIERRRELGPVFDSVLGAPDGDDRFHVGSAAPDLLGLRRTGAYLIPRVRRWLPGPLRGRLLGLIGRDGFADCITDWSPLGPATAAVFGHADLARRWPWRPRALAAAAELAGPLLGAAATAALLGVTPSAIRRARQRPVNPALVRAVQLQLQWRQTGVDGGGPALACGFDLARGQ